MVRLIAIIQVGRNPEHRRLVGAFTEKTCSAIPEEKRAREMFHVFLSFRKRALLVL